MSNIPITPGSGKLVATDAVSGVDFQIQKLDVGGAGASIPLVGTAQYGLPTDVTRVQGDISTVPKSGQVWPVNDNGGSLTVDDGGSSLTVDAAKTAPVSVRLSDGTNNVDTIPVSGTVTGNQGAPAVTANAWPTKITDGTSAVSLTGTSLNVNITGGAGGGAGQADETGFTQGTSDVTPVGGLYTSAPASPASGQVAAVQITQKRALHANLRDTSGNELGTSGNPVRTDPTGGTTQPVSIPGNTASAPFWTTPAQPPAALWSIHKAFTASQATQTIKAPSTGSKTLYIERLIITVTSTATAGPINIYDDADTDTTQLYYGTPAPGAVIILEYKRPRALSAVGNTLRYTTGANITGDLIAEGFEL